ncbi:MAG: hypothetical protein AAGF99_13680 [Bacteroidota bacterium]
MTRLDLTAVKSADIAWSVLTGPASEMPLEIALQHVMRRDGVLAHEGTSYVVIDAIGIGETDGREAIAQAVKDAAECDVVAVVGYREAFLADYAERATVVAPALENVDARFGV